MNQLSGIPRVAEIMDASRRIKTARMQLSIMPEVQQSGTDLEVFARSLQYTKLSDVVQSYSVERVPCVMTRTRCTGFGMPRDHVDEPMYALQSILDPCNMWHGRTTSDWVLRIVLCKRSLIRRGLVPRDIVNVLYIAYGSSVHLVASVPAEVDWVIRLRCLDLEGEVACSEFYAKVLTDTCIGGVMGISISTLLEHTVLVETPDGSLVERAGVCVETAGSCLGVVSSIPEIDWENSISNDIMDVYTVLGIAAARTVIFRELQVIICEDGCKVNVRHPMLVAMTMTQHGVVMPMSRHGINRIAHTGPLLRCSFEETSDVLTDAAAFAEGDTTRGISQSVIVGNIAFMGTGTCSVMRPVVASTPGQADTPEVVVNERDITKSRFRGVPIWVTSAANAGIVNAAHGVATCDPPYSDDLSHQAQHGTSCNMHAFDMNNDKLMSSEPPESGSSGGLSERQLLLSHMASMPLAPLDCLNS